MDVTTLHEVERALHGLDPDTLREMGYQVARSHVAVCGLTSAIGGCAHVDLDQIRDRVDGMTPTQLVDLLAPLAWTSIDSRDRIRP